MSFFPLDILLFGQRYTLAVCSPAYVYGLHSIPPHVSLRLCARKARANMSLSLCATSHIWSVFYTLAQTRYGTSIPILYVLNYLCPFGCLLWFCFSVGSLDSFYQRRLFLHSYKLFWTPRPTRGFRIIKKAYRNIPIRLLQCFGSLLIKRIPTDKLSQYARRGDFVLDIRLEEVV